MKLKLKRALGLSRRGWCAVIDNALTGLTLAVIAAGVLVLSANLSV